MSWQMSYTSSADLENSELQTDVMRFMAILAFCLVAIFAIVQTMPLEPRQAPDPVPAMPVPQAADPVSPPRTMPEAAMPTLSAAPPVHVPDPVKRTVPATPRPAPAAQQRQDAPEPVVAASTPEPVPAPPLASSQGLSLSFASDAVLRSLVERRLVGLFAIEGEDFYQMSVLAGRIGFRPGAAPARYHEMVYETVPPEVARTFESQQGIAARSVVWGVTLPPATTSQLQRFVRTRFTGSLVITADAQLELAGSG